MKTSDIEASDVLKKAIESAITETARKRSEKTTCPKERGGCGRPSALLSLTFNGVCVGKLCRYDLWCSLTAPKLPLSADESGGDLPDAPSRRGTGKKIVRKQKIVRKRKVSRPVGRQGPAGR